MNAFSANARRQQTDPVQAHMPRSNFDSGRTSDRRGPSQFTIRGVIPTAPLPGIASLGHPPLRAGEGSCAQRDAVTIQDLVAARSGVGVGLGVPLAAGVVTLTLAGMLWLSVSSSMVATGLRIAQLQGQRDALVEARAAALVALADASDPRRLSAQAKAMGFQPAEAVETVAVALPAIGSPSGDAAADALSGRGFGAGLSYGLNGLDAATGNALDSVADTGVAVDPTSPLALLQAGAKARTSPGGIDDLGLGRMLVATGLSQPAQASTGVEGAAQ